MPDLNPETHWTDRQARDEAWQAGVQGEPWQTWEITREGRRAIRTIGRVEAKRVWRAGVQWAVEVSTR